MPTKVKASLTGAFWGVFTVLCWTIFNVAAKSGIDAGMSPQALSFLRYATPGLFTIPLLLWLRNRGKGTALPLHRLLALSVLGGPLFGLMAVAGYQYAPLSHGLLFAPVAVFVAGTLLGSLVLKERIAVPRIIGAIIMFAGLGLLVGFGVQGFSDTWIIGVAFFVTAGMMWGGYTVLLRLWRMPILEGTVAVLSISAGIAAIFLGPTALPSLADTPPNTVTLQVFVQGIVGGVLSVFALMAALRHLTAQTASMLPTFTPAVALTIAWAAVGTPPELIEFIGAGVIFLGFAVATNRSFGLRPKGLHKVLTL